MKFTIAMSLFLAFTATGFAPVIDRPSEEQPPVLEYRAPTPEEKRLFQLDD